MGEQKNSFNQIRLAEERGQTAVVIVLCEKHLQKFPRHGPAWLHYGMAHIELANYEEAHKAIRRAIKSCPAGSLSFPYLQMGNLIEAQGDLKQAAMWYRKAAELRPNDATFHIFLGSNAWKRGMHKRAERHFLRALKCSEGCLEEAYFNLGGILLGKRNYPEAIKYYQQALKVDPKYKIAKERLADAELALLMTSS